MTQTIHIVGAGLAGLSTAIFTQHKGHKVQLYEAAPKAGGRIRQAAHHDNGTHLIIEGYKDTFAYLDLIQARDKLNPFKPAQFNFYDAGANLSWSLKADHLLQQILCGKIPNCPPWKLKSDIAFKRFWEPFILAVFNTAPKDVSKELVVKTFFELIKQGKSALRPYFCEDTLFETFVSPALERLDIQYGCRLIEAKQDALIFKNKTVELGTNDKVVLALPLQAYEHLTLPFSKPKASFSPITNIHFYPEEACEENFIGLIGTKSQWVYGKGNHICVTISAADFITPTLAQDIWQEIQGPLGLGHLTCPESRIICEKKATPVQDKDFQKMRKHIQKTHRRFEMVGDWSLANLPATIESAIRSGRLYADAL